MTIDSKEKARRKKISDAMKGNQHAIGNSGRPSKQDIPAMAKAIEEWSKRDDAFHLGEFSLEYDEYPQRLYEWRDKSSVFAEALKRAKTRIALRLRKKLHDKANPYNYGLFMRELPFYDEMLDAFEDAKEERKITLKAKLEAQSIVSPDAIAHFEAFMKQLKESQDSALKIAKSNKRADDKS